MDVIKTDLSKLTKSDSLVKKNVVFVMPFINEVECNRALDILEARSAYSDAVIVAVHDTDRVGFISVANTVYRRTRSEYFGYLASDVFPSRNWLNFSMQLFSKTDIGLLAYNDGKWFGRLASFGLADRSWISQYEPHDFFHSGYHSHYADTEMSALASATGKLGYNANIAMMEIDFEKDKKSVNLEDKILYANRMKQFISHNSNWQNPNAFMEFR